MQDDVNAREARMQALVNVLGFAELDDLETFVFLHGGVKVVPVDQRDTLPLDETQTQASEVHRAQRERDRRQENAQLKQEVARVRADLEWHQVELSRERKRNAEVEHDKSRLLDAIADLNARLERAKGCASLVDPRSEETPAAAAASPLIPAIHLEPDATERREHSALVATVMTDPSSSRRSADHGPSPDDAPDADRSSGAHEAHQSPIQAKTSLPETLSRDPSADIAPSYVMPTEGDVPTSGIDKGDQTPRQATPAKLPSGSVLALQGAGRPRGMSFAVSASPQGTPRAQGRRAVSFYPKLAAAFLEAREAVRIAQSRLANVEKRLAAVSDQLRGSFTAAVQEPPEALDLTSYPDPPPLPSSIDEQQALAVDAAFQARYSILRQQELDLRRHQAALSVWLPKAETFFSLLGRPKVVASSSKRPASPAGSAATPVRKKRKVQARPSSERRTEKVLDPRPTATSLSKASPGIPSDVRLDTTFQASSANAMKLEPVVKADRSPNVLAENPLEPTSALRRAHTPSSKRSSASPPESPPGHSASPREARLPPSQDVDENVDPATTGKKARTSRRAKTGRVAAVSSDPAEPLESVSVARGAPVKRESFDAGVPLSPKDAPLAAPASDDRSHLPESPTDLKPPEASWTNLDAPTPVAHDEETRMKLKIRNQQKRKRRREASAKKVDTPAQERQQPAEAPNTRRKAERQRMRAEACDSCTAYYERVGKPMQCAHERREEVGPRTPQYLDVRSRDLEERLQDNSRHRVQHATEEPPLDYWQFGFPSSGQVEEFNKRARARKTM